MLGPGAKHDWSQRNYIRRELHAQRGGENIAGLLVGCQYFRRHRVVCCAHVNCEKEPMRTD